LAQAGRQLSGINDPRVLQPLLDQRILRARDNRWMQFTRVLERVARRLSGPTALASDFHLNNKQRGASHEEEICNAGPGRGPVDHRLRK
jgi:hypothetical protein